MLLSEKLNKSCNLCGSNDSKLLFIKNHYPIVKCYGCGLVYVDDNTNFDIDFEAYYDEGYFKGDSQKYGYLDYNEEKECSIYNFRKHWERIEQYISGGKVLDVGCATGLFLASAGKNWQCYGLDISEYASKIACEEVGPIVERCSLFEASWPEGFFDLITMWDLLDHLPDPMAGLYQCHRLLNERGMLVLNVGDISSIFARIWGKRWYLMIPPTHLFFFSKDTIRKMLKKAGFEIFKTEVSGKYVFLKLCFFRLSYIFDCKFLKALSRYIAKSKIGKLKIYINFYDVMTLYARKRQR